MQELSELQLQRINYIWQKAAETGAFLTDPPATLRIYPQGDGSVTATLDGKPFEPQA